MLRLMIDDTIGLYTLMNVVNLAKAHQTSAKHVVRTKIIFNNY